MIGEVFNDTYLIKGNIGRGNMGAVYEAKHLRLGRSFALKVLHATLAERSEAWARFQREAQIASKLIHPNIVEVTDYNITDSGLPYLVMELLEGELLSDRISRLERFDVEQTASIVRQLAAAITFAHEQGVVHRDLKPSNILLCERDQRDDFIKVLDFGVSKVVGTISGLTRTNVTIGTPKYMAPEQAAGHTAKVDRRADIYAMGAILYEMLAGEAPISAGTLNELIFKVMYREPRPLSVMCSELPAGICSVIDRSLAKRPEERPTSMDELWQAFREATAGAKGASLEGAAARSAPVKQGRVTLKAPTPAAAKRGSPRGLDHAGGTVNLADNAPPVSQTRTQQLPGEQPPASDPTADTKLITGPRKSTPKPAEEQQGLASLDVVTGPRFPEIPLHETVVDNPPSFPQSAATLDKTTAAQNLELDRRTVLESELLDDDRLATIEKPVSLPIEPLSFDVSNRVTSAAAAAAAAPPAGRAHFGSQRRTVERDERRRVDVSPPRPDGPIEHRETESSWLRHPVLIASFGITTIAIFLATVIALSGDDADKPRGDAGGVDVGRPVVANIARDGRAPSISTPLDAAPLPVSRKLSISSVPSGADVSIDSVGVGKTPKRSLDIPTDSITRVRVTHDGYLPWENQIAPGNEPIKLHARLHRVQQRSEKPVRPRRRKPAILQVMTARGGKPFWADVFVDGKRVGQSPLIVKVKPGRHRIQVRRTGFGSAARQLTLRSGQRKTVRLELR